MTDVSLILVIWIYLLFCVIYILCVSSKFLLYLMCNPLLPKMHQKEGKYIRHSNIYMCFTKKSDTSITQWFILLCLWLYCKITMINIYKIRCLQKYTFCLILFLLYLQIPEMRKISRSENCVIIKVFASILNFKTLTLMYMIS